MPDGHEGLKLLILIARDEAAFDELVTGILDAGITGATIVESKGLGALLRQDMPIFSGLAALLPQHTGSRVVLSATSQPCIDRLYAYLDEMPPEQRPIGIVVPVEHTYGMGDSTNDEHADPS